MSTEKRACVASAAAFLDAGIAEVFETKGIWRVIHDEGENFVMVVPIAAKRGTAAFSRTPPTHDLRPGCLGSTKYCHARHGNRFLLTSRKHIYEAARRRLGQRNLAQFADGSAVVDVGEPTFEGKAQILYHHVNFGQQGQSWRSSVKPTPNRGRRRSRLSSWDCRTSWRPELHQGTRASRKLLVRFMEEPTEH